MSSRFGTYDGLPLWWVSSLPRPRSAFPSPLTSVTVWQAAYLADAVGQAFQALYEEPRNLQRLWSEAAMRFTTPGSSATDYPPSPPGGHRSTPYSLYNVSHPVNMRMMVNSTGETSRDEMFSDRGGGSGSGVEGTPPPGLLAYELLNEPWAGDIYANAKLLMPGFAGLLLYKYIYLTYHTPPYPTTSSSSPPSSP